MFNHHDTTRDTCMPHGPHRSHGYDWWWHSFLHSPYVLQFTFSAHLTLLDIFN